MQRKQEENTRESKRKRKKGFCARAGVFGKQHRRRDDVYVHGQAEVQQTDEVCPAWPGGECPGDAGGGPDRCSRGARCSADQHERAARGVRLPDHHACELRCLGRRSVRELRAQQGEAHAPTASFGEVRQRHRDDQRLPG